MGASVQSLYDWFLLVLKAVNPVDNKTYYFVDKCLPFGHAMSGSDTMEWIIRWKTQKEGVNYLDDFFFVDIDQVRCNYQMEVFIDLCNDINFPYAENKTVWATQKLVFLGLLIDALLKLICIPVEKVEKARFLIDEILERKSKKIKLSELQKLAGYLNFLCKAVVPGRPFVRRLYYWMKNLTKPHHHTRVTRELKLDLKMWLTFLNNPVVYCRPFLDWDNSVKATEVNFYTDASRNFVLGAGGLCGKSWFFVQWDKTFMNQVQPSIEFLELYAVTIGVLNWIQRFANKRIIIFCDNISVVYMINRNMSSCKQCLSLIRIIVLESMKYNACIFANYVSSKNNFFADCLSHLKIDR